MSNIHKILKNGLIILYFLSFIKNLNYGFLSILSICIHELAHILIIKLEDINYLTFSILGFRMDMSKESYVKYENLLYVSGSLLNILVGLLSLILIVFFNFYFLYEFMIINFAIGFINMLPVFPLDGAILFKNLLFSRLNQLRSMFVSIFVSFFLAIVLLCFILYLMLKFSFINLSYIIIIIFIFISTYKEYKVFKCIYLISGADHRRYKFLNKSHMSTCIMVLNYNIKLFDIIKLYKLNKFLVFYFVDDDLQIVGVMSEFDILKKYKEFGNVRAKIFYKNI